MSYSIRCYLSTATHPCNIPPTATFYKHVLDILITKAVLLPITILSELVMALYSVSKDPQINLKVSKGKKHKRAVSHSQMHS